MQAVLYVCHGSRLAKACEEAIAFVEQCKMSTDFPIQEICFIELADPDITTGIEICVKKGATSIIVIPILLLAAGHVKQDIPEAIQKARQRYPFLQILLDEPFGIHEKMVSIIIERMMESAVSLHERAMILLVARGSSDPDTKSAMKTIAGMLQQKTNVSRVDVCFLAAAAPSLEDALQAAKQSSYQTIFVVPYLLFTGVLMKKIEQRLRSLTSSDQQWVLCGYLGYHPFLKELIKEKLQKYSRLTIGV
ncbi:sirohydrochlorin chelatase [Anoxybacillus sp. UARK-01]|uniref:sirohydrochlorin chelatase n=1 Tax=Anoxybacillus sp. UARK-01 TaxID=1895648 RepID=UPI0009B9B211|nr:sirohydrochlorin chelatase [Anoxybacillus sp. UARK-01]OQM47305.1 sirohydrochlorin chelatase [Anoxybacillus sp. UARK-01]